MTAITWAVVQEWTMEEWTMAWAWIMAPAWGLVWADQDGKLTKIHSVQKRTKQA